ncbi:MAG: impact-like protein [Monoraphidium minutum]|nr:MAG: impact-like protein [Monoraphidium minutum]
MAAVAARMVSGEPLVERRSTFQAHACRVTDVREVAAVVAVLLQNNKIRGASHPAIMAYRISTPRPGVYLQDCDDDGEAAAGGRLLHLLQLAKAEDVVVVVSRWFGGILLGPSRFALISNCARALLVAAGFIAGAEPGGGGKKKARAR